MKQKEMKDSSTKQPAVYGVEAAPPSTIYAPILYSRYVNNEKSSSRR